MDKKRQLTAAILALATGTMVFSGCVVREETTVYEPRPRPVYVEQPQPVIVQPAPVVVAPGQPVVVAQQPVYVQPTPVIVQPAPVIIAQPNVIVVHRAPPPLQVEVRPRAPGREYVWVPGYYAARGESWVWVGGAWSRPPRAGAVWVAPRYDTAGTEVHFSAGFWR